MEDILKVYTVYFNEDKHPEEIELIEEAMRVSPDSKSSIGRDALVKEAKKIIKSAEKKRQRQRRG